MHAYIHITHHIHYVYVCMYIYNYDYNYNYNYNLSRRRSLLRFKSWREHRASEAESAARTDSCVVASTASTANSHAKMLHPNIP